MRGLHFARWALAIGAIIALASCGGSQPPNGAPGAMPQTGAIARPPSSAYRVLHRFQEPPNVGGDNQVAPLLDVSGRLYGTTEYGGSNHNGLVYRISTGGAERLLYRFGGGSGDGINPTAGLVNVNGTLYGTTLRGGNDDCGTVYSISKSGEEKVIYNFRGAHGDFDGRAPWASLIDVDGTLYGTTRSGGYTNGIVYRVSTEGAEKVLYRFSEGVYGGQIPTGGLVNVNGTLYGTTRRGGVGPCKNGGCGTVYRISQSGVEKEVYRFRGGSSDGANPHAGLIDVNGRLYGTTFLGGLQRCNKGCGIVYSVTARGKEEVLYDFGGAPNDGLHPSGGLLDVNGTLYGTTAYGGTGKSCGRKGCGTIYSVSTLGVEQVLHSFAGGFDGAHPKANLIDVNGTLYGTTTYVQNRNGGTGSGTVFALTP